MEDARPDYTPLEALRKFEPQWARELAGVTLAGELDVPPAEAIEILSALVRRSQRDPNVLRRYPACVVVSMSLCAQRVYKGGALWDGLFEAIGQRRQQGLEAQLGQAYIDALDALDKPRPASHFRFVAAMALHACIPDYCVPDLLTLLASRQEASPGIDGRSLISWANGAGGRVVIDRLDRPVRDFFDTGDDYAVDLADRIFDLLDALRRGERNSRSLRVSSGVPARFAKLALSELVETGLELRPIATAGRPASAVTFPHIILDLDRWSIVLRMPSVRTDGRAWWNVTLDNEGRRVQTQPTVGGSTDSLTEMVVDKPVRTIGVGLGTSELRYALDIVDGQSPVVIFDEDGTHIPSGVPLPASPVWLLHPSTEGAVSLGYQGQERVMAEAIGPVGWNGWALVQVDLARVRAVEINGVTRAVRRSPKATIVLDKALAGIRTVAGDPIHAVRPTIDVPMSASDREWTIDIRDTRDGTSLASAVWTIEAVSPDDESDLAVIDPFDGWEEPIVGSFEILARGPLGTRNSWRISMCEGLRLVPSVEYRSFVSGGLTPMSMRLDATTALSREPTVLDFGVADLRSSARITGAEGELLAEVEPLHLEICHASPTGSTEWSPQPLTLTTDGTEHFGTLEVRMPTRSVLPPLQLQTPDGLTQSLVAHRGGAFGLHRFELSRLSDTVRGSKTGDLGWDFGEERTTLVHFRPRQLASAISIESDTLVLHEFAGVSGVVAGIHSVLAPWRDPVVVHFDDTGAAPCPPELLSSGPLRAEIRIDDPWVPSPWEPWHGQGLPITQEGMPDARSTAEGLVISYLAGKSPIPHHQDVLPLLWELLNIRHSLREAGVRADVKNDIALVFRGRWVEAVQALQEVQIDPAVVLRLAIRLGLVEQVIPLSGNDARILWPLYPAIASLASSRDDVPVDAMVARCGDSVLSMLRGDNDPHAAIGRFDQSLRMNFMPTDQVKAMLDAAGIVPEGLLDGGTRVVSVLELFLARGHWSLLDATNYTDESIATAMEMIRNSGYPKLAEAIAARPETPIHRRWQRLPQMSLLMAGLARVGSRGFPPALRALDELREAWAAMTKTAYAFVATDIILAELLVISDDKERDHNTRGHSAP